MSADTQYIPPLNWIPVHGADATGAVDSSAAITVALTEASTSTNARTVYLGPGTFKCNIVIPVKVRLVGAGSSGIGDWDGAASGPTTLIPNSDASAVVSITDLDQQEIHNLNIKGNGSGTSVLGLSIANAGETYPGSGFLASGLVICDFTKSYFVASATNCSFENCAFLTADRCINLKGGADSHSFERCCIGGLASGTAIYSEGNSASAEFINCEMGHCTKILRQEALSVMLFLGGNIEDVGGAYLFEHIFGQLHIIGTRIVMDGTAKPMVRSTASLANSTVVIYSLQGSNWATYAATGRLLLVETSVTTFRPTIVGMQGAVRYVTDGTFVTTLRVETELNNIIPPGGCTVEPNNTTGDNINVIKKTATGNYGGLRMMTGSTINWDFMLWGDADFAFASAGGSKDIWAERATLDWVAGRGNIRVDLAGKGLRVKEGSNAKQGVSTLVAGTVTVANTSVTANSRIFLTVQSLGTVAVATPIAVTARTAATSFTITSAGVTDTSVVAWEIFEPA